MDFESNPPLRLLMAWQAHYPQHEPQWLVKAPGRDMWVAGLMIEGHTYQLYNADTESATTFDRQGAKRKRTVLNRPLPRWARYPAGVIFHLSQQGLVVDGMGLVLAGDEPPGPRYDYGLGMAIAALVYTYHQQPYDAELLLQIVDAVRRDYME